jgi:hypothetical protein
MSAFDPKRTSPSISCCSSDSLLEALEDYVKRQRKRLISAKDEAAN